jgi:hypothetical protein
VWWVEITPSGKQAAAKHHTDHKEHHLMHPNTIETLTQEHTAALENLSEVQSEIERITAHRKARLLHGDMTSSARADERLQQLRGEHTRLTDRASLLADAVAEAKAENDNGQQVAAEQREQALSVRAGALPLLEHYDALASELADVLSKLTAADAIISAANRAASECGLDGDGIEPLMPRRGHDSEWTEMVMTWWDFPSARRSPSEHDGSVVISANGNEYPPEPEPLKVNHRRVRGNLVWDTEAPERRSRVIRRQESTAVWLDAVPIAARLPHRDHAKPDYWNDAQRAAAQARAEQLVHGLAASQRPRRRTKAA